MSESTLVKLTGLFFAQSHRVSSMLFPNDTPIDCQPKMRGLMVSVRVRETKTK